MERNECGEPAAADDARAVVGCGVVSGAEVRIVNPKSMTPCAPLEIGEIWVSGSSVAKGYWNRPEETDLTFCARLPEPPDARYLRTGDLGFIDGGELFITGRLKDLIIIRGLNHYPQDIEITVQRLHPAFRPNCGAAFGVSIGTEERLVVVQGIDRKIALDREAAIDDIREAIAYHHGIDVYGVVLTNPAGIPRTSSGKIRRSECRSMFLAGQLGAIARWVQRDVTIAEPSPVSKAAAPRSPEEVATWLAIEFARVFRLEPSAIDPEDSISRYGLDSLKAMEIAHSIELNLGVVAPISTLLEAPSLSELAANIGAKLIDGLGGESDGRFIAADRKVEYPLSFGQQSIWYINQVSPESAAYNIPAAFRVRGNFDAGRMRRALETLLQRHPALRTTFSAPVDGPVQRVRNWNESILGVEDARDWTEAALMQRMTEEARRPFDLEQGPLVKMKYYLGTKQEGFLLFVAHHIVTDLWSLVIILQELRELYSAYGESRAPRLAAVSLEYQDYVAWQRRMLEGSEGQRLRAYWEDNMKGELPVSSLLTDRPRPPVQTYRGNSCGLYIGGGLAADLEALAKARHATTHVLLLAAFHALLHRYTNQENILVGVPTSGRTHQELRNLVGFFVNPVAIRTSVQPGVSFAGFLEHVRKNFLGAMDHQEYPFSLLVEHLSPGRDASRSPVFQVMLAFQRAQAPDLEGISSVAIGTSGTRLSLGELDLETVAIEMEQSQFDLTLKIAEVDGGLSASFEYNADLFDQTTISRMLGHLEVMLQAVAANADERVSCLALLTERERSQIVGEWNRTYWDYGPRECLHERVELQSERTPDAIAVVFEDERISFGELNHRANQLARHLRRLGVGPEKPVGVLMERSAETPVGLLGVLKAGAPYLPLDPEYPQERLDFMIEDAAPSIVLCSESVKHKAHGFSKIICLDSEFDSFASQSSTNFDSGVTEEDLAYVIYTSGSTGKPKGAMNTHRGICNRLLWMQEEYRLTPGDAVLQKTPFSFDVSVWEIFWPLMTGAPLVLARPGGHQDPAYLIETIEEQRITTLHFVPSMLEVFLEEPDASACDSLRRVICSGEALAADLQERFFGRMSAGLHNLYGPTEAAVDVTYWACDRATHRRSVPIGRPIANIQCYVLDETAELAPMGVAGELHLSGVGLARGYLNRAALTAEKFVPDPFGSEPGSRLYRTGDLARWMGEGEIEYLGRLDNQVKLRGFRIELGEIESVLRAEDSVREAVVVVRREEGRAEWIVAYVVRQKEAGVTGGELRDALKKSLPDYMIPAAFVFLDRLPLTPNGKVDRRALPEPEISGQSQSRYVAPVTSTERSLARIWAEMLRIEEVGAADDFFDLGGHSLLATQVASRVRREFNIAIPLGALFTGLSTLAAVAAAIDLYQIRQFAASDLAEALRVLEEISDDEVKELLSAESNLVMEAGD